MSKCNLYATCFLCFLGFGMVGTMDYEDEQKTLQAYCDGVSQNVHPDYDRKFNTLCVDK